MMFNPEVPFWRVVAIVFTPAVLFFLTAMWFLYCTLGYHSLFNEGGSAGAQAETILRGLWIAFVVSFFIAILLGWLHNFRIVRESETFWAFEDNQARRVRPGLRWRDNLHIVRQHMGVRWMVRCFDGGVDSFGFLSWEVKFHDEPSEASVDTYHRWVEGLKMLRYNYAEASAYIAQATERDDLPFRIAPLKVTT